MTVRAALPLFLLLAAPGLPAPAAGALQTLDEVEACVRANEPEESSVQTITLKAVDRMGSATISNAEIFFRRFPDGRRALLRFNAPPDVRGSSLLLIQKEDRSDMFMYLPELGRVRRVTKRSVSGSMFGTDLTYEDFERLQGMSDDVGVQLATDSELDGRGVYVVEATPVRGEDSDYEKIVSYVDQETCVPLKVEHFQKGGVLRKVLHIPRDKVIKGSNGWVPRFVRVEDLKDETHTELTVDEFDEKAVPKSMFSERALLSSGR